MAVQRKVEPTAGNLDALMERVQEIALAGFRPETGVSDIALSHARFGHRPLRSPPHSHVGLLRKFILFAYVPTCKSVVIEPTLIRAESQTLRLLEHGGEAIRWTKKGTLLPGDAALLPLRPAWSGAGRARHHADHAARPAGVRRPPGHLRGRTARHHQHRGRAVGRGGPRQRHHRVLYAGAASATLT